MLVRAVVVCAAVLFAAPSSAHPVPFTYLDLRLGANAIEGSLVAHMYDLGHDLKIDPADRLLDPAFANQFADAIPRLFDGRLEVAADGRALTPQWSQLEVLADRQSLRLHLRYALDATPGVISVTARMFPYDPYHQSFLNLYEGPGLTQAILDGERPRFDYYAGTRQGVTAVARLLLPLGVTHILLGQDHLVFLIGLLLLGGTARQLAAFVGTFTVAHTVTLTLAASGIIIPSTRLTEPALALSIVYLGADNLMIRGGRDVRVWIAAGFGGIHGFSYAVVLRNMDLPARALAWSMGSFTAGTLIAQVVVGGVTAWIVNDFRVRSGVLAKRIVTYGSVGVIAAGSFWFVERVFFLK